MRLDLKPLALIILGIVALITNYLMYAGRPASSLGLWADTVAKSPLKARPHVNYGNALMAEGRWSEARREYETTLVLADPLDPFDYRAGASANLASLMIRDARYDEAIGLLRGEGIRNSAMAGNLAVALIRSGEPAEAERVLRDAWSQWRDSSTALNLAEIERLRGRCDEADEWYAIARSQLDFEAGGCGGSGGSRTEGHEALNSAGPRRPLR